MRSWSAVGGVVAVHGQKTDSPLALEAGDVVYADLLDVGMGGDCEEGMARWVLDQGDHVEALAAGVGHAAGLTHGGPTPPKVTVSACSSGISSSRNHADRRHDRVLHLRRGIATARPLEPAPLRAAGQTVSRRRRPMAHLLLLR